MGHLSKQASAVRGGLFIPLEPSNGPTAGAIPTARNSNGSRLLATQKKRSLSTSAPSAGGGGGGGAPGASTGTPLYQSLDQPAHGRRLPGSEYAVLRLDGDPNSSKLPGQQYLGRTASDRLGSGASGTGYHDMEGFGDDIEA